MSQSDGPDTVRALLCALSARGSDLLAPVSTLAVQNELTRRNATVRASQMLSELEGLRDVQRLRGGFWLPAPLRLVACGGTTLATCGLPSHRLTRQYELEVEVFGYLRVLLGPRQHIQVPILNLFEWLRVPSDSTAWLDQIIHDAQWSPPYHLQALRIFRSWKSRVRARWVESNQVLSNTTAVLLAKTELRDALAQYYLADIRRGLVERVHELPSGSDIPRVMCVMRRRDQDPTIAKAAVAGDSRMLPVQFEILPAAEARFFRAMGRSEASDDGFIRTVEMPRELAVPSKALLDALGVSTQGIWL